MSQGRLFDHLPRAKIFCARDLPTPPTVGRQFNCHPESIPVNLSTIEESGTDEMAVTVQADSPSLIANSMVLLQRRLHAMETITMRYSQAQSHPF